MIGFMFNMVGKTVRGVVDLTTEAVNEVIEAPSALIKGYEEGFSFKQEAKKEEPKSTANTVDDTPSFAKKGA